MTNPHILDGGILAQQADAPLIRGRNRWDSNAAVRLTAGTLVLASVLAASRSPG
jgi:hypothetical protein